MSQQTTGYSGPRSLYAAAVSKNILAGLVRRNAFRLLNGLEMVNDSLKRTRWWSRFGLRTLLVILLAFAIYFALGQPTKTLGVRDVSRDIGRNATAQYKAPLLLEYAVVTVELSRQSGCLIGHATERRSYYLWFFGAVTKLPFTSEMTRDFVPSRPLATKRDPLDAYNDGWRHHRSVLLSLCEMQFSLKWMLIVVAFVAIDCDAFYNANVAWAKAALTFTVIVFHITYGIKRPVF